MLACNHPIGSRKTNIAVYLCRLESMGLSGASAAVSVHRAHRLFGT